MSKLADLLGVQPTTMQPTAEQAAVVAAARGTTDNLLISALAGAAKTTTLVLIAEALPTTAMLCLAFNKRIAVEMQKRLPSTCVAKTLNSVGYTAWSKFLSKRFLEVDEKKTYRLTKAYIEGVKDPKEKFFLYSKMADLMRAVDAGKTCGWLPAGSYSHAKPLMTDEEFREWLDEEPSEAEWDLLVAVSVASMKEAYAGLCDFNDQILCPTIFPASFIQYPVTLVDEAQDLSALNHVMLEKIVGSKRIIAVGDECQSIYGFRGAHANSMRLLQRHFEMKEFILSTSFRCPIAVVKEAQWRAPHMRYPEWAKPGAVSTLASWDEHSIPESAAILCRNNAPLFSLAFTLLRHGRYPELVGNDLGKMLVKTLKSLGDLSTSQSEALVGVDQWEAAKLTKARNPGKVKDQALCLRIFIEQGETLGEAIAYCERILAAAGPIKLMTGHKSKGLEFDHVFILDQELIGKDAQDLNLRYVMQTRAKETLTYITSKGFDDGQE